MNKKDIIKKINEEISRFDFLNNNSILKEREEYDILDNLDFQKRFVFDVISGKPNVKIVDGEGKIGRNWDDTDDGELSLEYESTVTYHWKELDKPIEFKVFIDGDDVPFSVREERSPGDRITPEYVEAYITYIDWDAFEVFFYTKAGDETIPALNRDPRIKELFVRKFVEVFIQKETLPIKR